MLSNPNGTTPLKQIAAAEGSCRNISLSGWLRAVTELLVTEAMAEVSDQVLELVMEMRQSRNRHSWQGQPTRVQQRGMMLMFYTFIQAFQIPFRMSVTWLGRIALVCGC